MKLEMRAWHKKKKWMDGVWLVDIEHGLLCFTAHNQSEMKDCVLMLWIGLVDKNGVKIYEGDILTDSYKRVLHVVWWNHGFQFKALKETNFAYAAIGQWFDDYTEAPEVIGNIYENPELSTKALDRLIGGGGK